MHRQLTKSYLARALTLLLIGVLLIAGMPGQLAQQPDCRARVNYAEVGAAAFEDGDYAAAVEAYTCVITLNPTGYEGFLRRSEAALLLGDYVMALLDRSEAIGLAFNEWPALSAELNDDYTAQIADDPANLDALRLRSFLYLFDNETENALADLEAILKADFDSAYAWIFRALAEQGSSDSNRALADFERAAELEPGNPAVFTLIGSVLNNNTPNTTEGLAYLERAIEIDPDYPYAYYVRAAYNSAIGAPEAAIQDYTAAIDNGFTPAFRPLLDRATLYVSIRDLDAALADYDRLIELDPTNLTYYQERINIFLGRNDLDSVVNEYTRLIALNPDEANHFLSRGTYRLLLSDADGGAQDFLRYTELLELDRVDGGELKLGDTVDIVMSLGRNHYFTFTASEGDVIEISATSPDRLVDPLIVVVNSDGEAVVTNDDIDATIEDYNALIVWEVPYDGEFTLIVSHAAAGSEGDVAVSFGLHGVEGRGSDA